MPELKFLANMNISVVTVQTLRASGWQIVRVSEVMDPRRTHLEILHNEYRNIVIHGNNQRPGNSLFSVDEMIAFLSGQSKTRATLL